MASVKVDVFNPKIVSLISPASYAKQQFSLQTFQRPVDWKTLQATKLDIKTPIVSVNTAAINVDDIFVKEKTAIMQWNEIFADLNRLEGGSYTQIWGKLFQIYDSEIGDTGLLYDAVRECALALRPSNNVTWFSFVNVSEAIATKGNYFAGWSVGITLEKMAANWFPNITLANRFKEQIQACLITSFLMKKVSANQRQALANKIKERLYALSAVSQIGGYNNRRAGSSYKYFIKYPQLLHRPFMMRTILLPMRI